MTPTTEGESKRRRATWFIVSRCDFAIFGHHPQNPGYHDFANQGALFGIPNFWLALVP